FYDDMGAGLPGVQAQTLGLYAFVSNARQHRTRTLFVPMLIEPRQWHHLALVTGPGGMKLFLDGFLVGTNGFLESFNAIAGTRNFIGGWNNNPDGVDSFAGEIDEFRVWKVARTQEEIRANLGRKLSGTETGLVGLWNFDDPTNPGRDASAGAHHGK